MSVIVTDFKMPKMNGADLLIEAKKVEPEVKGIIVSAFLDSAEACKTVHSINTYCVITKPVNFNYLVNTIKSAVQ
ncbi:MAG: response regulator [Nitrospinaceae bacterium]